MKKVLTLTVSLIVPFVLSAQDKDSDNKKFGISFSGFVRNDVIYNTRQVVSARGESDFLLVPKPVKLDSNGNDINSVPNFNIVSFTTRIRGKITGPDAFGAKTSGLIETDFFGSSAASKFDLRLRHAIIKLDWKKGHLMLGQYWHPMFVTDCYPKTVSFGAGVTFNPFSRNPQIRYKYNFTKKISIAAAAISQGQYKSKGNAFSHQNAGIPEFNVHMQYKDDVMTIGAQFDYQTLMPRIVTDSNYATKTTISTMSYLGYIKIKLKPVTLKLYQIYGQGNDNMVMMGGYAIANKAYSQEELQKNYVEYLPYNTRTNWIDIESNGKKIKYGLFLGYSENLGAKDSVIISSFTGRWGEVKSLGRIAPRMTIISNNLKLGFEIEYSGAEYSEQKLDGNGNIIDNGINQYGKVTNYKTADNLKFLFSASYIF